MKPTTIRTMSYSVDSTTATVTETVPRNGRLVGVALSMSMTTPTATNLGTFSLLLSSSGNTNLTNVQDDLIAGFYQTQYSATLSVNGHIANWFPVNVLVKAGQRLYGYFGSANGRLTGVIQLIYEFA